MLKKQNIYCKKMLKPFFVIYSFEKLKSWCKTPLCTTKQFVVICSFQFRNQSKTSACFGQNFAHLPHLMHFSWLTVGALNPSCSNAPTGHIDTDGHLWFCGHLPTITLSSFSINRSFVFKSANICLAAAIICLKTTDYLQECVQPCAPWQW